MSRWIALFCLAFVLSGCTAKPASPPDPCMPEYRECVKQFVDEKLLCLGAREGEARCEELFKIGLKECQATYEKCGASLTSPRRVH